MDILRFITAGNVDDGKSTLIGRLLFETNNIKDDIIQAVSDKDTKNINLAHITDGLRNERQQGITIDVAYKYFTTKSRKYIITDAPGHFQYTKNLVTGASGVDLMIILIDAQHGITEQTMRHSLVASFLKTGHVVVAVNKMDIVGYDEQVFIAIRDEYIKIAEKLKLQNIAYIPISALVGDNVSHPSDNMKWYKEETLMQYIENCTPVPVNNNAARFSIQYVIDGADKGYAGKLLSGILRVGDIISIYPKKEDAIISRIIHSYSDITEASKGQNIVVFFVKNNVAQRGNLISYFHGAPKSGNNFEATVCWLNDKEPLQIGTEYFLRINSIETCCTIIEILYKIDINSFENYIDESPVEVNQFAKVKIETMDMVAYDEYATLPENGRGVIIDKKTNYTSGAFVI